jgi:hypothetical protein
MRGAGKFGFMALALLAASPSWALDDEHSYSLINASTGRVDFADQNARMGQNGFVNFTILTVLATGSVAYSLSQVSINCAKAQLATVTNSNYAANGAQLPADTVDSTVQPISTGTLGQSLQVVVCNGVDPYPRSKAIKGLSAAVAKARELIAAQVPAKK